VRDISLRHAKHSNQANFNVLRPYALLFWTATNCDKLSEAILYNPDSMGAEDGSILEGNVMMMPAISIHQCWRKHACLPAAVRRYIQRN
jgi:hypothetical protein